MHPHIGTCSHMPFTGALKPLFPILLQAMELLADIDRPNVAVHLDTYHMNIEERSMQDAIAACGDKLGCAVPRVSQGLKVRNLQGCVYVLQRGALLLYSLLPAVSVVLTPKHWITDLPTFRVSRNPITRNVFPLMIITLQAPDNSSRRVFGSKL